MDFTLSEDQQQLVALADRILSDKTTPARLAEVEAGVERFDRDLWAVLASTGLLGLAISDEFGGSGAGLLELCVLLEQQGRRVASVPLWATLVAGAWPVAQHGSPEQRARWLPDVAAGTCVMTGAFESGCSWVTARLDGAGLRLEGHLLSVPAADLADCLLVPVRLADEGMVVVLVDLALDGVSVEPTTTTDRQSAGHVTLRDVRIARTDILGGSGARVPVGRVSGPAVVGICALGVGIAEEAVRLAATYTSERHQFGRAVATFQGVALKAADAYIDTEAMRVTMWQAAWRLNQGLPADAEVAVAKWWAAHGCHRVVHAALHLHGGVGNDLDYPLHRYFLWGKQAEVVLGGASQQRADLGRLIASGALG